MCRARPGKLLCNIMALVMFGAVLMPPPAKLLTSVTGTGTWWAVYTVPVVGSGQTPIQGVVQAPNKMAAMLDWSRHTHVPVNAVVAKGPYQSKADAQGGSAQVNPSGVPLPSLPNPLAGLAAVGDFFNRLTEANTWLRVGEVAAGLILLYLGLNAAFRNTAGGQAVRKATSNVRKAGKRAAEAAGAVAAA